MLQRLIFIFGTLVLCVGCWESRFVDQDMIAKQREHESLEKDVFDRLVFTLSETKMPGTFNFKFVVRDQLGREWMFKTTGQGEAVDGELAIYNHYRMFGVGTPEIHSKTFNVNGENITGTLQLLLTPNLGPLTESFMRQMAMAGRISLAKLHALSWLSANHHVHPRQFLVLGDGAHPTDVVRIDNSVEWFLIGNDRLTVDYQTPVLWSTPQIGYARFWRLLLIQKFELPMDKLLAWIRIIQDFPDDIYAEPFEQGIQNELKTFANNAFGPGAPAYNAFIPEVRSKVDKDSFLPALLERKKNLVKDMSRFYADLLSIDGKSLPKIDKSHLQIAANEIKQFHENAIVQLRNVSSRLDLVGPKTQEMLEPEISFAAYRALRRLTTVNYMAPQLRTKALESSIDELKQIIAKGPHPNDRHSAQVALRNIERLREKYEKKQMRNPGQNTLWIRQDIMQMNDLLSEEGLRSDRRRKGRRR